MKKIGIMGLTIGICVTLAGCANNTIEPTSNSQIPSTTTAQTTSMNYDQASYISQKNESGGEFVEIKAMTGKIDDIKSVSDTIGVSFNTNNTSLSNYQLLDESNEAFYEPSDFKERNVDIVEQQLGLLESQLENAKHCEKMCYDNHIITFNHWEYWGDGNGQVRSIYDRKTKEFTWEKLQNEWIRFDEATNNNIFYQDGRKEYRKYTTKEDKKGKLEIHNIGLLFNENTEAIRNQFEFIYSEDNYFDYYEYNTYDLADENDNKYIRHEYTIEHVELNEKDKSHTSLNYVINKSLTGETLNGQIYFKNHYYFKDYLIEDIIIYDIGDSTEPSFRDITVYNYDCERLMSVNGGYLIISLAALTGFDKVKYNSETHESALIDENGNEIELDDSNSFLSFHFSDETKYGYLSLTLDEDNKAVKTLNDKNIHSNLSGDINGVLNKVLKLESKTKEELLEEINNFKFYDKAYRDESMKESTLEKFYAKNDVETEIEGYVQLKDNILDLSNFKVVIDAGGVYQEGKRYNIAGQIWLNDDVHIEFTIYKDVLCQNGKLVIENLGVHELTGKKYKEFLKNKNTRLMLHTYDPNAAFKLILCDIKLDNSNGKLNGTPQPISYEEVEWR